MAEIVPAPTELTEGMTPKVIGEWLGGFADLKELKQITVEEKDGEGKWSMIGMGTSVLHRSL